MSITSRLTSAVRALLGKSVGGRVWARLMSGSGAFGLPGSWSQERREQVLHWRGWPYVAGNLIAEEIAGLVPQVGYVRQPEEYEEKLGKAVRKAHPSRRTAMIAAVNRRFVRGRARQKSLAAIGAHEEMELADSDHRLVRLLRRPNDVDTGFTFHYRGWMYMELTGSWYIWAVPDEFGLPCELWTIPSQWVWPSPIRERDELISWYEIRPYGTPGGAGVFRIPAEELIPVQYPHPLTLWDGFSPLAASAAWVDVLESMDASQFTAFGNQINEAGVIEFDASTEDPDDPMIERLRSRLAQRNQGVRNAKAPVVLSPGAKLTYPRGATPVEMDYTASGDTKRDWVLAARGISKFMAGISDDVNRATALAAVANFIRKVIRPKLLLADGVLTERLARQFDDRLVVYHDDPTPDDPEELRARYQLGQTLRAVTPNEYRVNVLGLEPFAHGGDDPIGAPTDVPLPFATGEDSDAEAMSEVLAQLKEASQPAAPPGGMNGAPPKEESASAGLSGTSNTTNGNGKPPLDRAAAGAGGAKPANRLPAASTNGTH